MIHTFHLEIVSGEVNLSYTQPVDVHNLKSAQEKISQLLHFIFEEQEPKEDDKNNDENKNSDEGNGGEVDNDERPPTPPSPPNPPDPPDPPDPSPKKSSLA